MAAAKSWGFPRWSGYGRETEPEAVRLCDFEGCREKATHKAPKSAQSDEKWWFCLDHVTEFNRNWDYFAGLSAEEAEKLAREEEMKSKGYEKSNAWSWAANGKYGAGSVNERAHETLELEVGADDAAIKRAYRRLAKRFHPDTNPGDEEAAKRFHEIRAAYDYLTSAGG